MPLTPVYGHEGLLARLEASLASGRFPQAALFLGPAGAGKQRLALWVAQGLLCERGAGRPCDDCQDCRLVRGLGHPDLHWLVPIPRPKGSDPAKQIDEVREALAEVWTERRAQGQWTAPDGAASHSLASVRWLQRVVSLTPFRARRKVVIVGDAERLVVQEASPEAANALLKVLEEPPADTTVILTAAEPQALLPTVRSRVVPLRVGAVGDEVVRTFLERELEPPPKGNALERRVTLAEGLIGRALARDEAGTEGAATRAQTFLEAVQGGAPAWAGVALGQAPWGARGDFAAMLDALAIALREQAAALTTAADRDALARRLAALRRVDAAREGVGTNVNPQLALATLARELEPLV